MPSLVVLATKGAIGEGIGLRRELTICTYVGQPAMIGLGEVFSEVEHRKYIIRLVTNLKKKVYACKGVW